MGTEGAGEARGGAGPGGRAHRGSLARADVAGTLCVPSSEPGARDLQPTRQTEPSLREHIPA